MRKDLRFWHFLLLDRLSWNLHTILGSRKWRPHLDILGIQTDYMRFIEEARQTSEKHISMKFQSLKNLLLKEALIPISWPLSRKHFVNML